MYRKFIGLILAVSIMLIFSAFPILANNHQPLQISAEDIQPLEQASHRAACTMVKHTGNPTYYNNFYTAGFGAYTYYDPAVECGGAVYPFEITGFTFTLYDFASYTWPVNLDIVVYDMDTSGYQCNGPTVELCRYSLAADEASYSYPAYGTFYFPSLCCVDRPFYIGVEYTSTDINQPSVLYDTDTPVDTCDNWLLLNYVLYEWFDWWGAYPPGYFIFEVEGETVSQNCFPQGACCLPDGQCTLAQEDSCLSVSGLYLGDGTVCMGVQACCMPDGSCYNVDAICCLNQYFGTPQGPGTSCAATTVACCLPGGGCVDVDPICCDDLGGTPSPFGVPFCALDGNGNGIDDACEDPEWDAKMHYPQLPDEYGWDVNATYPLVLADDWQCTETGYIKDIHFWGSYLNDLPGEILGFILSIHKDIPAGAPYGDTCYADGDCDCNGQPLTIADMVYLIRIIQGLETPCPGGFFNCDLNGDCVLDTNDAIVYEDYIYNGMSAFDPYGGYPVQTCCDTATHSRPGGLLWERYITNFNWDSIYGWFPEGWYDPSKPDIFPDNHWKYYRYDIYLDSSDWYPQDSGLIYWLNISAMLEDTFYQWGWKSSIDHWNDDAVWAYEWEKDWDEMYEPNSGSSSDPITNHFYGALNANGGLAWGGGSDYYGQGWYEYPSGWWNIWFYDHPFDSTRYKEIHVEFRAYPMESGQPAWLEFALNWSTDWWWIEMGGNIGPPLPGEDEEMFIGRHTLFVDSIFDGYYEFDYVIPYYNPEYVSIDIQGYNVVVDSGIIIHECKSIDSAQSLDLSFVITGEPYEDTLPWNFHYRGCNHPDYDTCTSGLLTVWGTVNCDTTGHDPIFQDTAYECENVTGKVPAWANDILINFKWHCFCQNDDWAKLAAPVYGSGGWTLTPLQTWYYNSASVGSLPGLGQPDGTTIYYVIDLYEWPLVDPPQPQETYEILDGTCPDLPGYLIGTTPIEFDPDAPEYRNSPFSTTPYTGTLYWTGDLYLGGPSYICGDANGDGIVNVSDAVWIINYVFVGGDPPDPLISGDANCDETVNVSDAVWIINYVFVGGNEPCDTTGDGIPDC
jgi:hypothetical protein